MRIEQSFVVKAPRARVWGYLTDPYRVVTALPGAAVTEKVGDTAYGGTITVKVGPVSARYRGTARFEKLDPAAGTADIVASGQDVKGKGGADMRMQSRLTEIAPGRTEVSATSQVNITGILAQMGARMIQDVSDQMFERFTAAVRQALEQSDAGSADVPTAAAEPGAAPVPVSTPAEPAAPPIEVLSFGGRIAGRAVARATRQPFFWGALVLLVLAVVWLLAR